MTSTPRQLRRTHVFDMAPRWGAFSYGAEGARTLLLPQAKGGKNAVRLRCRRSADKAFCLFRALVPEMDERPFWRLPSKKRVPYII